MELADALYERCDRLVLLLDQRLHAGVAHHEIGRRCVLVEQQARRPGFERFHEARRLTRGSAGILTLECRRAAALRKVADESVDIDLFHPSAIFGANLDETVKISCWEGEWASKSLCFG